MPASCRLYFLGWKVSQQVCWLLSALLGPTLMRGAQQQEEPLWKRHAEQSQEIPLIGRFSDMRKAFLSVDCTVCKTVRSKRCRFASLHSQY